MDHQGLGDRPYRRTMLGDQRLGLGEPERQIGIDRRNAGADDRCRRDRQSQRGVLNQRAEEFLLIGLSVSLAEKVTHDQTRLICVTSKWRLLFRNHAAQSQSLIPIDGPGGSSALGGLRPVARLMSVVRGAGGS
jgi:hypothetical protein